MHKIPENISLVHININESTLAPNEIISLFAMKAAQRLDFLL